GALGHDADGAVPALIAILERCEIRTDAGLISALSAVAAIGEIGPGAQQAVPSLGRTLAKSHGLPQVQAAAADALSKTGDGQMVTPPELSKLAKLESGSVKLRTSGSGDREVAKMRIAAGVALWRITGNSRVIEWLNATAQDEHND